MKIKTPDYVKLIIEKFDSQEQALISKELITTTEKTKMNLLVRDLTKYFLQKKIFVIPYQSGSLANINVMNFFVINHKELRMRSPKWANIYFKLKFFDPSSNSLKFDKEKITQKVADEYIQTWCQGFNKGYGFEKNIQKGSFYYLNKNGGYSVCDNSNGDCFCEDFETEIGAQRYLGGWCLDEIEFGERDHYKNDLKAYEVGTDDHDGGNRLIFAETANKAKSWCIKNNLLECKYIEMHSIRVPEADKYLKISIKNELNWGITSHQIILIEKLGWEECY